MTLRKIEQIIQALAVSEGAGVVVHRTLGTPGLRQLDPFLMLDHFASENPDDYIAGFPDHPHRGFITLTYMLDGHMLHQDSMGNRGDLRAGGIQWMKAASGVIHSEMPQQTNGLMRGFQLWINLPAAEKMSRPGYQEYPAARIPEVHAGGVHVKVISGEYASQRGPVDDPHTQILYLDVALAPNAEFSHALHGALSAFLYPFEGEIRIGERRVATHNLVVLGTGDQVALTAGERGARLILVAGRPLNEPIVQYGPFVMSTEKEIREAIDDYRNDRLVRAAARVGPA
ncbi:MAG: pirin family protein [Acidiferrobacterales bacterium]